MLGKPLKYQNSMTKVINGILGVGFTSRLFDHLRKAHGWAYETASFYQGFRRGGDMTLYIGTDPKNEADVLKGIDHEITDLKTNKVTSAELERNKSQIIGDFLLAHEGMAAQAQYLALYETMGLGFNFDSTYSSLIEKVTSDDVLRMAKKLFNQPTLKVIVSPASVRQENE